MALAGPILGTLIDDNLASAGANGSNRTIFSTAVGTGIVNTIIGATFTTDDTGTVPGSGVGEGLGIVGLTDSLMVSSALAVMTSQGDNASPLMQAIMQATITHLSLNAELDSTHDPVFSGTGEITVGSISVTIPAMKANIESQLTAVNAIGDNVSNLSEAIATGVVNGILSSGAGSVTITGSPSSPTTSPGTGSGTGVIS